MRGFLKFKFPYGVGGHWDPCCSSSCCCWWTGAAPPSSTKWGSGRLGDPPPSKPDVYSLWSHAHHFQLGDSLLFLYPPSQDSVVQVTEKAFNSCSLSDPILKLSADGNSVFNLTAPGRFYFTSGVPATATTIRSSPSTSPPPTAPPSSPPPKALPLRLRLRRTRRRVAVVPAPLRPLRRAGVRGVARRSSAALAMGSVIAVALLFIV
uniref:Phytocyanin domain-containing protein n=1 Tax=Ananas comosus var. bracteatus TaxID=296719 RepID=A0A6V7QTN6_ANACO